MRQDIWKFSLLIISAAFLGFLTGHTLFAMLLAALAIIAWQVYRLHLMHKWLLNHKKNPLPETSGQFYLLHKEISRRRARNKKRKNQLAQSLKRFRKAVAALPDAIVLINDEGEIEWANEHAASLLGVHWPEDNGIRLSNLIRHPMVSSLLDQPKPEANGIEIESPFGNGFVHVKCISYTENLRMVLVRDVSRLLRINKMHKDFVANVSHELKTPLTVLRGYIEVMNDATDDQDAFKKPIQQMAAQSERMQNIVNDLLYLSKLENQDTPSDTENIDISVLLGTIIEAVKALLQEKKHKLELDIEQGLMIRANRNELHTCFSNLLINAIHYTPDNGIISLRWKRDGDRAVFSVKDNGIGINTSHIERLTERFYRIDDNRSRKKGGTGLGLAIVKHTLQRHHATLDIDSTPGVGSEFRCLFPNKLIVEQTTKQASNN